MRILITENILSILSEATATDIFEKYYKDKITSDIFQAIIKHDPTTVLPNKMGNYSKWLIGLYLKKNLKTEDLYKANDYLESFDTNKPALKRNGINIDINTYKSLPELFSVIESFRDKQDSEDLNINSTQIKKNEAEKVFESSSWVIVVPKTERAACYYGKGTQWCTAANNSYNAFDDYNEDGNLYININKATQQKFQFHFEAKQFMDANDRPIDLLDFMSKVPELKKYYDESVLPNLNLDTQPYHKIKIEFKDNNTYFVFEDYGDLANLFTTSEDVDDYLTHEWQVDPHFELKDGVRYIDKENTQKLIQLIQNKIKESDVYDGFLHFNDEEDFDSLYELLEFEDTHMDSEIHDIVQRAGWDAMESGTQNEAFEYVMKEIQKHFGATEGIEYIGGKYWMGVQNSYFSSPNNIKWVTLASGDDGDASDNEDLYITHSSPQYGFSNFDEEYFNERIKEEI